ncbi:MAG: alpha/beta hydrolase [Eubacteriales bacterium]|nr:alpha/beta hydrolase [Eubacteriales bacterium]
MLTVDHNLVETFTTFSKAGTGQLWADLFRPESEPAFNMLIVHGMAEHRLRYHEFANWMTLQGAQILLYDQAGHGQTAQNEAQLGFFSAINGDQVVLQDLDQMLRLLIDKSPNIPTILMGHSMGSLIVRDYLTQDGIPRLAGVILTGTSGPNPALPIGRLIALFLLKFKGPYFRSKQLDHLLHAGFLGRIKQPQSAFDWLTRDQSIVNHYIADPLCGYLFTTSALLDLMAWTDRVSQPNWANLIPLELPIMIASGSDDPVGQYGLGIRTIADRIEQAGRLVEFKLYENARHEILNEVNRETVYQDLRDWIFQSVLK